MTFSSDDYFFLEALRFFADAFLATPFFLAVAFFFAAVAFFTAFFSVPVIFFLAADAFLATLFFLVVAVFFTAVTSFADCFLVAATFFLAAFLVVAICRPTDFLRVRAFLFSDLPTAVSLTMSTTSLSPC